MNIINQNDIVFLENKVINCLIIDGKKEFNIFIKEGITVTINRTGELEDYDEKLTFHLASNSTLIFHDGIKVTGSYKSNIKTIIEGDNTIVEINGGYVVNDQAELNIKSDAIILDNTNNSKFDEIYYALVLGDSKATILPNMLISNNNVIANHGVTISGISKDYLFYLNSHGVNDKDAIELIKRSIAYKYIDITNFR